MWARHFLPTGGYIRQSMFICKEHFNNKSIQSSNFTSNIMHWDILVFKLHTTTFHIMDPQIDLAMILKKNIFSRKSRVTIKPKPQTGTLKTMFTVHECPFSNAHAHVYMGFHTCSDWLTNSFSVEFRHEIHLSMFSGRLCENVYMK